MTVTTEEAARLRRLADAFPGRTALMGSWLRNCEKEAMVVQSLHAAVNHLESYGEPFSFRSDRVYSRSVDNAEAYRALVADGLLREEKRPATDFTELPLDVAPDENSNVVILFVTKKLLLELEAHIASGKAQ